MFPSERVRRLSSLFVLATVAVVLVLLVSGTTVGHAVGLVYHSPAVADGELYVTSSDGHLYALDSEGTPRWTVYTGAEITTPATVRADAVLFGTADGRVVGVDRTDGAVILNRTIGAHGVTTVVATEAATYASVGERVVSLGPEGRVAWRYKTDGFVGEAVAASERGVYVGSSRVSARNGTVRALDAEGAVRWSSQERGPVEQITVRSDRVYHSAGDDVVARAANGTELWRVEFGQLMSRPAVHGGTVVVGSFGGTVAAIDGGDVVWEYQARLPVAPAVVDDAVYATTPRELTALRNGTELWTQPIGATVVAPPTVGGDVYVGTQMNRTYAVSADGSFSWINRYSTTTEDIPWDDGDGRTDFWNPRGRVTRVVRPDGTVVDGSTGNDSGTASKSSHPTVIVGAAAVLVAITLVYWRR